jgi:hypothetical protein
MIALHHQAKKPEELAEISWQAYALWVRSANCVAAPMNARDGSA